MKPEPGKKREQQSAQVRRQIIDSARQLFLQQGFDATTMRQIGQAAHVTTGSLYHFFEHKDAIFLEIVREVFAVADTLARQTLHNDPDPYLNLMLELGVQLKTAFSNDAIAGLYLAAHHSATVTGFILETATARNRQLFGQLNLDEADLHLRTLLIKGCLTALIEQRVHSRDVSLELSLRHLLPLACHLFGLPDEQIGGRVARALEKLLD